ncbi:ATP-binding cassette domain-containing protein [Salinithrix halophila]|uniref:ATP-binding cassette domain-containing protein n=1 Tax=Salinithrix halophila TaxID=1485204 RepID=A0ABV8JCS8_9BACL
MRIEWSHVNKRYQDSVTDYRHRPYNQEAQTGLLDFTASVRRGITAVLGPEGAGKTTLLRVTAASLVPDDGRITYQTRQNEVQVWSRSVAAMGGASPVDSLRRRIGYVPRKKRSRQELTVEESFHYLARFCRLPRPRIRAAELIAKWGLAGYRKHPVKDLPDGPSARYIMARSLVADPVVWLLDEPAEGLDELGWELFCEEVAERHAKGITLIATNDLKIAEAADVLLLMENGTCRRLGQRKLLTAGVPDGTVSSWYKTMQTFSAARSRTK